MGNTRPQHKTPDDTRDDPTGSETHSANTGGVIPNDAASYDPDYDPGASDLSADLADEFEKNGPGLPNSTDG